MQLSISDLKRRAASLKEQYLRTERLRKEGHLDSEFMRGHELQMGMKKCTFWTQMVARQEERVRAEEAEALLEPF